MDTKALEKFAQSARQSLHEQVAARLTRVLTTDSAELRAKARTIEALKARVKAQGRDAVIEQVAYTWFNRFCALRYMDVNAYTRVGTVSPVTSPAGEAFTQPEILQEAKLGHIDEDFVSFVDAETVFGLLNGRQPSADPQQEAYRLLLVAVCNSYHDVMPFMFEEIDHYTELLMPDDLLSAGSILQAVREALTPERCQDVEVIGWLYQFYISEKKDAVMARKGAVPPEDIPAVTQLFTPHWIVRYMVENSLGRLWMLNHPDSRLVERMDYYIPPPQDEVDGGGRVDSAQGTVNRPEGESARNGESSLSTDHRPLSTSVPPITSPEDIRLCDPACGSGHILTYAFDLLVAIYEEQGYNPVEIPRLILEKNLTGIEIDERAGALAGFALMMKARARDRRFFRRREAGRAVLPNIVVMEDVVFTPQELDAYMDAVGRDLFTQDVRDWLQQFEQATVFGSLIRPLVTDTAFIRERLDAVGVFQSLFLSPTGEKLDTLLDMSETLSLGYHVIVANPPYLGSRSMNNKLKVFLKGNYDSVKSDLFAAFMVRILNMVQKGGFAGIMTPFTWMFLNSYEELRYIVLDNSTLTSLVRPEYHAFFESAFVPICAFTLQLSILPSYEGTFIDLSGFYGADIQPLKTLEAIRNPVCGWLHRASASDFRRIPGSPLAYWVSEELLSTFEGGKLLGEVLDAKTGITTGNNPQYIRSWSEVSLKAIGFNTRNREQTSQTLQRWYPLNSGGSFRKWYGNFREVVLWQNDGEAIRSRSNSNIRNQDYFFREGLTWGKITSSNLSVRYSPVGSMFDAVGLMAFPAPEHIFNILGLLNSNLVRVYTRALNPTLSMLIGDLTRIPFMDLPHSMKHAMNVLVQTLVQKHKLDWDGRETSWDFAVLPLLEPESRHSCLANAYRATRTTWQQVTEEMQHLEEETNRMLIEAYGLQHDLVTQVPVSEITLSCNPHYRYGNGSLKVRAWDTLLQQFPKTCQCLSTIATKMAPNVPEDDRLGLEQRLLDDTMREFISYAVGCMFGRYSLDKPGLILANQGETVADYVRVVSGQGRQNALTVDSREKAKERITFMPDEDNVIPILDGEWFADDITERFKQFLRVTFGSEHYEENLAFIEAAIGRDIRGYFLREFYDDHVKTYQKRPIYWLFSSPNGSFNALIYMHRYQPDTVSIVLNDYLREYAAKLTARKRHLEQAGIQATASQRDKAQATKEVEQIDKILAELRAYEDEVLYPLAMRRVEIDLDDGVAVNYPKFGRALARVKGLS